MSCSRAWILPWCVDAYLFYIISLIRTYQQVSVKPWILIESHSKCEGRRGGNSKLFVDREWVGGSLRLFTTATFNHVFRQTLTRNCNERTSSIHLKVLFFFKLRFWRRTFWAARYRIFLRLPNLPFQPRSPLVLHWIRRPPSPKKFLGRAYPLRLRSI